MANYNFNMENKYFMSMNNNSVLGYSKSDFGSMGRLYEGKSSITAGKMEYKDFCSGEGLLSFD